MFIGSSMLRGSLIIPTRHTTGFKTRDMNICGVMIQLGKRIRKSPQWNYRLAEVLPPHFRYRIKRAKNRQVYPVMHRAYTPPRSVSSIFKRRRLSRQVGDEIDIDFSFLVLSFFSRRFVSGGSLRVVYLAQVFFFFKNTYKVQLAFASILRHSSILFEMST